MTLEGSGRSELAHFVPDHVLGHQDFDMLATVVNHERVSNEFRNDGTGTSPSFDWLFAAGLFRFLNFAEKLLVNVRAFFL